MENKTREAILRLILYARGFKSVDYPLDIDADEVEKWLRENQKAPEGA